jgi:nitrate reductase alpha subunit
MSYFLDRLQFFRRVSEPFANGHGEARTENRDWEDGYRARWQYDKVVRSTHGVNCTGSCSWKIYVKNGLVTWETQQTDYPRTRPDLPNHEPRGCPRGASYSWYLYSANRLKYPLVRGALLRLWREARKTLSPVDAWASIVEDAARAKSYKNKRGMGGLCACAMGRGERNDCRFQFVYRKKIWTGSRDWFFSHSRDVDGVLCGRCALFIIIGRCVFIVLRLVL